MQPQSQTVTAGTNVTFSVAANGKPAPTCQWFFNGVTIGGATSSTFSLTGAQSANAGNYTVSLTNSTSTVTSNTATLTVNPVTTPPSGGGSSGGGGGGGGGGAPSVWFCGALSLLALAARMRRRLR
jgi:outer membrane autotransporter protein